APLSPGQHELCDLGLAERRPHPRVAANQPDARVVAAAFGHAIDQGVSPAGRIGRKPATLTSGVAILRRQFLAFGRCGVLPIRRWVRGKGRVDITECVTLLVSSNSMRTARGASYSGLRFIVSGTRSTRAGSAALRSPLRKIVSLRRSALARAASTD